MPANTIFSGIPANQYERYEKNNNMGIVDGWSHDNGGWKQDN